MSNMSIANQYSVYSSLISSTYYSGATSSSNLSSSLLNMYASIYGTNTANTSTETSSYLVDVKEESGDMLSTLDSLSKKGSSSLFANTSKGVSDSDSVSVTHTGNSEGEKMTVDVEQIATAQKNESSSLNSNASTLYYTDTSSINLTTADGKSLNIDYSAGITETNKKVLTKIADKINSADMGVTAKVENDTKTNTSKLVIEGNKTGADNSFTVTGDLAEALGINTAKVSAQDAVYTINGTRSASSTNKIEVDDNTSLTLKSATTKTANISYSTDYTDAINSARELVNNFNALTKTATDSKDSGASKLAKSLKSTAETYSAALNRIGVTLNSKGYLEIDEDKMKNSAESGELANFFNANSKSTQNYGFAYRLETIASRANEDPTTYLSNSAKAELNSTSSLDSSSFTGTSSYNYISAYYKYSTSALLFDSLV